MQKERIDRPKKYTACIYSQHIQRLLSFPFTQIHPKVPQRRNLNNFPVNSHVRFWCDSLSVGWMVGWTICHNFLKVKIPFKAPIGGLVLEGLEMRQCNLITSNKPNSLHEGIIFMNINSITKLNK